MGELTPWDFLKAINETKEDLFAHPGAANAYIRGAFIINRHLSYFPDTVMYANEMNFHHHIPAERQFHYLRAAVPRKRRWSKWGKPDKQEFSLLQDYFQFGPRKVRELLRVLTPEQIETIRRIKEDYVASQ